MRGKIAEFLNHDPGGWPRFSKAAFAPSDDEASRLAEVIKKNSPKHPIFVFLGLGLFLAFIAAEYGLVFASQVCLLFFLPVLCLVPAALLRPKLLGGLPSNHACAWPMDLSSDRTRRYTGTLLAASTYWLMSAVIFVHCAMIMRSGMGDQWNPFTRTIHIVKGGPYSEYGPIEAFMFISGFFAVTGLVWWPMIAFFEWLETRSPAGLKTKVKRA